MRNTDFILNIYEKKNSLSKLTTQLLYGENFTIQKNYTNWIKIKSKYDNYVGYIKKKKFKPKVINTHKVNKLSAEVYKKPNKNSKIEKKLSFCSFINVKKKEKNFYKFDNYWIKKKDVAPINKTESIFSKIKIFKNVKYKWGGASFKGIDCSALVQIFYKFNGQFCPRDTKDQISYFKKNIKINNLKKNNLIFWTGHVAVCLSKKKLIHAYGPKKKVLIMNIKKTINEIKITSKLEIKSIKKNESN
jgi:cell wall-associated NlpC family hydrolase